MESRARDSSRWCELMLINCTTASVFHVGGTFPSQIMVIMHSSWGVAPLGSGKKKSGTIDPVKGVPVSVEHPVTSSTCV